MTKQKEVVIKTETSLANEEWYHALLEDCQAIIVERGFRARMEVVEGKWELGKRVCEENDQMNRKKIYGERIVENLSNDLGMSNSSLFACVQFFKQFPVEDFEEVIPKLPGGKETSWSKITQEILGQRKDKNKTEKFSYKLTDICEVLKSWLYDEIGLTDEKEINSAVLNFKESVIKYKEKK